MAAARDGDTIRVLRDVPREPFEVTKILRFVGDGVVWDFKDFPSRNLAQRGKAVIVPASAACEIDGFEISGAGLDLRRSALIAAIRNESAGWLTIRNCMLHHCQNNIASGVYNAMIEVIDTRLWAGGLNRIDTNGNLHGGQGDTHNLYVNAINTLTLRNVWSAEPVDAHAIKYRGVRLIVEGGYFESERARSFDIYNGRRFTITGATLSKPASASNGVVLGYASENRNSRISYDNTLDRCTLNLRRHLNTVHTTAGRITFAPDCVWNGNRLGVNGGGLVLGIPS